MESYLFAMPTDEFVEVNIDEELVTSISDDVVENDDLSRYIL